MRCSTWCILAAAVCLLAAPTAPAYVDLAPTLARIVRDSQSITVAEVVRFRPDRGAALLKKVRDLKGKGEDEARHQLVRANEKEIDPPIASWAEPGRRCVLFVNGKMAIVCVGEGWYQASQGADGWWRMGVSRPDLPLAYYGNVSRLVDAIPRMIAGKTAIITALPHGIDAQGASFDLALNRAGLPGLVKVQRIRASLRMPTVAMAVGANPEFVVGMGRSGPEDIPGLLHGLRSADASVRAESATDLGFLGSADGSSDLARLLDDQSPAVRLAAASALLRLHRDERRAMKVLEQGLTSDSAVIRRQAARAAGLAGDAAAPLGRILGTLLKDADTGVRRAALQAIATLGPAAIQAREPVAALLDQPETAIDAADALGRMGPAARPAMKALARLLSSSAAAERWAALRAMAQIGGEDATPAVKVIIRELPKAPEIEGYNMLIYLALLGPVAREAIPAARSAHVRNPLLRQITVWALDPDSNLPSFGPMGDTDIFRYIPEAFLQEMGDHFRPAAQALARRIMAGKAGDVPVWGYKLLARFPDDALATLTPGLSDKDLTQRERAAVALGYMGPAARAAKPQVDHALQAAQDEREQRLLRWCLRELK